ncbi:methionyl-tRNA formyltransferase [Propionibacterium sp.]|uniref:methionyl-tRNA formyltransferase n=1 Tax=Propionibacterium sp. TaxID=1977903 RepID=UPI0039ECF8E8
MRIAFAGTPAMAVPSLKALIAAGHEVVAVVTRPDAPLGRSKKLVASPVAQAAGELGVPVLKPERPRDPDFVARLTEICPEACAVVAYGALLPQKVLDIPVHGWINLHFSLLPRWRGAAPVQRALMAGDTVTGTTTFRIVKQLDAGPIFRQDEVEVTADETAGELLERLAVSGADQLVGTFDDISAGSQPIAQPDDGITVAHKVSVQDAHIDWKLPAEDLARLIRGTSPSPGAWSTFEQRRFKILAARVAASSGDDAALAPGELAASAHTLLAGTGQGNLELIRVQAFGKKAMNGADWARGAKPGPGERLDEGDA